LSADVINNETGGSAYYPDIKKFQDELEKLNVEVNNLKDPYIRLYQKVESLRGDIRKIADQNELIYTRLDKITKITDNIIDDLKKHFNISKDIKSPPNLKFDSTILSDIAKYLIYGVGFATIGAQGVALSRAFYSQEVAMKVLSAKLSNTLKNTNFSTNRLRYTRVSKFMTGMAVVGVAMAVYTLVKDLQAAKEKRDVLEKSVNEARTAKNELEKEIKELENQEKELLELLSKCIKEFEDSYISLIENLKEDTKVELPEIIKKLQDKTKKINDLETGSQKQIDELKEAQKFFMNDLEKILSEYEQAYQELQILNLIKPLAKGNVSINIITETAKVIRKDITEQEVLKYIKTLGIEGY
jgi:predicted RNase H-like nuclease (RuvC/YqgF family)